MNEEHDPNEEYYEEEELQGSSLPDWLTSTPYWMISTALHVIVLLIFGTVVVMQVEDKKEERRTVIRKEFKPPEYDPTKKRAIGASPDDLGRAQAGDSEGPEKEPGTQTQSREGQDHSKG